MGAWGQGAFDNDHVLDVAPEILTSIVTVRRALADCIQKSADDWAAAAGHGAAEVVAAALAPVPYWQSEGTTLFEHAAMVAIPTVYLPSEVADFVASSPEFTAEDVELALEALAALEQPEALATWFDPEARRGGVNETRKRLQAVAGNGPTVRQ